jgi:hypothetical protein
MRIPKLNNNQSNAHWLMPRRSSDRYHYRERPRFGGEEPIRVSQIYQILELGAVSFDFVLELFWLARSKLEDGRTFCFGPRCQCWSFELCVFVLSSAIWRVSPNQGGKAYEDFCTKPTSGELEPKSSSNSKKVGFCIWSLHLRVVRVVFPPIGSTPRWWSQRSKLKGPRWSGKSGTLYLAGHIYFWRWCDVGVEVQDDAENYCD